MIYELYLWLWHVKNLKNVKFIIYDGLVLFYEHCFSDAAFCLYCYLFKRDVGEQAGGDTFVTESFSN